MDEDTLEQIEQDAIRRRAFELSQLHPEMSDDDNWLQAEKEINASLMAKIEMSVFGHS
jgi:hypothetical protein